MKETEIKFRVEELDGIRKKLNLNGAVKKAGFFEDNLVFDDQNGSLFQQECLLRLRKSDKITLTFKKPIEKARYKIMEELEIEVSDFDKAFSIFTCLGYKKVFRYQKNREIFSIGGALVCLDQTPIGSFVEIEGEQQDILKSASILEMNMEAGTSKNYMELYREHCSANNITPSDMVF
ncbi:MAG: class IV adenylate cyclase [Spirochaetota bacterium]